MGSAISLKYDQKYDISSGGLSLTGELTANAEQILTISGKGSIDNVNKGKSYTINLDDIELSSRGESVMSFDAKVGISTQPQIQEMDSSKKVVDLFTVTKEEFDAFEEENAEGIAAYRKRIEEITNKVDDD